MDNLGMNSSSTPWILIALVGALVVLLGVVFLRRKKTKDVDYRGFFYVGLGLIAFGLFEYLRYGDFGTLPLGVIFTVIGWSKRDKWKKK